MKRFQGHFGNITSRRTHTDIGRHFNLPNHKGLQDIEIHILDFIDKHPDSKEAQTQRDEKEYNWIQELRSYRPRGLNIIDPPKYKSQHTHRNLE